MRNKSVRHLLAGLVLAALPISSFAFVSVGISINIAPPPLPVYVQPPCPAVGYIWTPGYWAYADDDYYWVPGTWVLAPEPGLLWTPGYWGWIGGSYVWHEGYWGPHVGFYGGVNYGFGYGGVGFEGGYWRGHDFYYNRSVSNINNIHVTNVYNRTVINNVTVNNVSYNGGTGGLSARPGERELAAEHDRHVAFTPAQQKQEHLASTNRDLRASVNGGKPRIAATSRPAVFTGHGVVGARAAGGPARPAPMRNDRPPSAQHGNAGTMHVPQERVNPANADRFAGQHGSGAPQSLPHAPSMTQSRAAPHAQSTPHPQNTPYTLGMPRPQSTPHPQNVPPPQAMPRPQSTPHPQNVPPPQAMPRPQNTPFTQSIPRPQNMPPPQYIPHPQNVPPPASVPHVPSAPHPQASPREAAEPHGGGDPRRGDPRR